MKVIGLTGGVASGKSAISQYLRKLGAEIIDADVLARELVVPSSPGLQAIVEQFGPEILQPDATLNRQKLGHLIFSSPQARFKLNGILHPLITAAIREQIQEYRRLGTPPLVVLDAPLLMETNLVEQVDEVWLVAVSPEIQLERLVKRDHLTLEEARQRLAAQMSLEEKKKAAHRIIDNSGHLELTLAYVHELWQKTLQQS